jgi:uncharacterized protein (TIGR03067 family)
MAIKIKCRKCEAKFSVKDAAAGRRVKCRECGAPIKVPVPKTDEDELLDFDTAAYGDDPSGDDPYGDDVSTATQPLPRRRRKTSGNKRSASSGGKKSSGSSRGLIIGLSAGGGLLVIALLALAFWPEKPSSEVADASDGDNAESSLTTDEDSTSPTDTTTTNPFAPVAVSGTNPSPPVTATTTKPSSPDIASVTNLEGDLSLLQGTWQLTDVESSTEQNVVAEFVMTWTFKDNILFMSRANEIYSTSSVSLDPTASPRTFDMTNLDDQERAGTIKPAIYAIDGETLKVCMSMGGKGTLRPGEMKPKAPYQLVLTFKRTSLPTNGDSIAAASGEQFDLKAWQKAVVTLKAMKILSWAQRRESSSDGLPDGVGYVAVIDARPRAADGSIPDELWEVISSVSHVIVRTSSISDTTVRQLSQHPGLVGLNISGRSTVTAAGIAELKKCPNLRSLHFSRVPVSPELLNAMVKLDSLTRLSLYRTQITDAGLVHLKGMTSLTRLYLDNTQITDAGLEHLKGLTSLTHLYLRETQITDAGLVHLKGMTSLTWLHLDDTQITDAGLVHLKGMTSLTELRLSGPQITDAGLEHLKGLTSLTSLDLIGTQITDAGLEHLKGLTSLTVLDLFGTQITDAGLAEIKAALPKCSVGR